jgi:protein TonB
MFSNNEKKPELSDIVEVSFDFPSKIKEPIPEKIIEDPQVPEPEPEPVKEKITKNNSRKPKAQKVESKVEKQPDSLYDNGDIKTKSQYEMDEDLKYKDAPYDAEIFKYPEYAEKIVKKIHSKWKMSSKWRKLRAVVFFVIHRDGLTSHIKIKESSGNSDFDQEALDTIRKASSFPELPKDFTGKSLSMCFEFRYKYD